MLKCELLIAFFLGIAFTITVLKHTNLLLSDTNKKHDTRGDSGDAVDDDDEKFKTVSSSQGQGGYFYGNKFFCNKSQIRYVITKEDRQRGTLNNQVLQTLEKSFRNCGVIALEAAVAVEDADDFRQSLEKGLRPILKSRKEVRDMFKETMRSRGSLNKLALKTMNTSFFRSGKVYKERNDGRIDVELLMEDPYNRSIFTCNNFAVPLFRRLLGSSAELKSLHAMFALSYLNGTREQHWHRDTSLLFAADNNVHELDVHARENGMHEPPYALNMFIQLAEMEKVNGPTEFILGSHLWATIWADDEADDCCEDYMFTGMPPGSLIISDYRTIHRGTINLSRKPRPLAMFIYGRDWWTDTINYGLGDYGGLKTTASEAARHVLSQSEVTHMLAEDLQLVARAVLRTQSTRLETLNQQQRVALLKHQRETSTEESLKELLELMMSEWEEMQRKEDAAAVNSRRKMFKGMLAKWGESLSNEIRETLEPYHRLSRQLIQQKNEIIAFEL